MDSGHFHAIVWRKLHNILLCWMVMVNLEEVQLDRRVEERLVGRCHDNGLDFLHGDGVLALGGHKKGGEISGGHHDASQKKAKGRWTHMK